MNQDLRCGNAQAIEDGDNMFGGHGILGKYKQRTTITNTRNPFGRKPKEATPRYGDPKGGGAGLLANLGRATHVTEAIVRPEYPNVDPKELESVYLKFGVSPRGANIASRVNTHGLTIPQAHKKYSPILSKRDTSKAVKADNAMGILTKASESALKRPLKTGGIKSWLSLLSPDKKRGLFERIKEVKETSARDKGGDDRGSTRETGQRRHSNCTCVCKD